jgi:site-specific recombinase XerD
MKDFSDGGAPPVLLDFLSYIQTIKGKSPNTVLVYFYDLRMFLRFLLVRFGAAPAPAAGEGLSGVDASGFDAALLDRVTLSDLYAFMSYVSRERGNSSHARARKAATLKSFFNYLHAKAKVVSQNPAAELESPKIVKRQPRYLSRDESVRLLDASGERAGETRERDFAIVTLFLNCGMRLSELVGINLSRMRGDTLTIVGKGGKERTVYLNQACLDALGAYLERRPRDGVQDRDALFLSKRKRRISVNMVQRVVKRDIRLAGLDAGKYSAHKLRHTAATLMYQHGHVDIRALQRILGHESVATTEIYTHLDERQLKEAVESNPLSGYRPPRAGR